MMIRLSTTLITALSTVYLLSACAEFNSTDEQDAQYKFALPSTTVESSNQLMIDADTPIRKLQITTSKETGLKSFYSVQITNLNPNELIKLFGELQVTRCNNKDINGESGLGTASPCSNRDMQRAPYDYAPKISAAYFLSDSPDTISVNDKISSWVTTPCFEDKHHCALTLPEIDQVGLQANNRWIHIGVSAHYTGADQVKAWHIVRVEGERGRLQVARIPNGVHPNLVNSNLIREQGDLQLRTRPDGTDVPQDYRLVYQQTLAGLRAGDLVTASAAFRAKVNTNGCDPMINSLIFISDDPNLRAPERNVAFKFNNRNGYNCTARDNQNCIHEKNGALMISEDKPGPVYVSYVTTGHRTCINENRDTWKLKVENLGLLVSVFPNQFVSVQPQAPQAQPQAPQAQPQAPQAQPQAPQAQPQTQRAPATPSNFVVVLKDNQSVKIKWTANGQNQQGFIVQRKKQRNNGEWKNPVDIASVSAHEDRFIDTPGSGTYKYRVLAYNQAGMSGWTTWEKIEVP